MTLQHGLLLKHCFCDDIDMIECYEWVNGLDKDGSSIIIYSPSTSIAKTRRSVNSFILCVLWWGVKTLILTWCLIYFGFVRLHVHLKKVPSMAPPIFSGMGLKQYSFCKNVYTIKNLFFPSELGVGRNIFYRNLPGYPKEINNCRKVIFGYLIGVLEYLYIL